MNLQPETVAELRPLLVRVRDLDARIDALTEPVIAAQAAISRLRQLINDLDEKAAQATHRPISPDEERVSALIAGQDVPQKDKREIDALAASARLIIAQRLQAVTDLGAVEQRSTQLTGDVEELKQDRDRAEATFLYVLASRLFEDYKRSIIGFISEQIPPLLSACDRYQRLTGEQLSHVSNIHALSVGWPNLSDPVENAIGPTKVFRRLNVWPRHDGTLLLGEPSSSPRILAGLCEAILAHPEAEPEAESAQAPAAA